MRRSSFAWFVVLVLLYSCVTVNIYFPAQEAQKKAKEIVNDIRKSSPAVKPQSLFFNIFVQKAFAADYLNTTNAKIRLIKQRMRQRFFQMKPFYESGYIGETLDGYIKIVKQPKSLKDRLKLRKFVAEENSDRNELYDEVAQVLHIQSTQIDQLRRIFAKQWQDTAPKGTYIQTQTGWVRK